MASESSDDGAVSLALPSALDEWLETKATDLGVDREAVVVQLLASYRAASELDDGDVGALVKDDLESGVRDVVADRIPDIANAVSDQVDTGDAEATEDRLEAEIDSVEREFREKLQDVRERIVQVKRETDAKAPEDHAHPELDELDTLSEEVGALQSHLDDIDGRLADVEDDDAALEDRVDALEGLTDRLDDAEEKLQTVAWVVSDLRDSVDAQSGAMAAIDRLKRSAAEADVDRALCDSCGSPVDIALLSEPTCPHCDATVSDVELPSGFFGKPRLTVAQQLEAGPAEDSNVPDAARRE